MEFQEGQEQVAQVMSWLQKEGLPPGSCLNQQLCYLWHTLQQREGSLASVTHDLERMRSRHAGEMAEVQRYLEHIRSLSEERDTLGRELEQDNEELRGQLQRLLLQQDTQMNEVAEMLYQEGLAEVIPSSPSEQVAYLLVERASLLERPRDDPEGAPTAQGDAASVSYVQAARPCLQGPTEISDQSLHKEAAHRGQSPWKRLFGLRKAAQGKHTFIPIEAKPGPGLNVARECARLERDLEEASRRLAMAHKEIRRLADELESARLTQSAYEPELQSAQQEVEQLRQEVEKLKKCDVAELRKAKELNDRLDLEIRALRARVRFLVAEGQDLQETLEKMKEDSDPGSGNGEAHPPALPPDLATGEGLTRPKIFHVSQQTDPPDLNPDALDDSSPPEIQVQQLNQAQQQLQRMQAKYDTSIRATMKDQAKELKKLKSQTEKENNNLEDLLNTTKEMERQYSELKSKKEEAERDHKQLNENLRAKMEKDKREYEELRTKMEAQLGEFREQREELEEKQNLKEQLQLKALEAELADKQQMSRDLRESLIKSTNTCSRLQQQINILTECLTTVQDEMASLPHQLRSVVERFPRERSSCPDPSSLEEGEMEREDGGRDTDLYLVTPRSQAQEWALEEGVLNNLRNLLHTVQQQLRHITEDKLSLLRDKARIEQDNGRMCAELAQEQQKSRDLMERLVQSTQYTETKSMGHTPLVNQQQGVQPQLDLSQGEKEQGMAPLSQESQSGDRVQSEANLQEEMAEACGTRRQELEERLRARQEECKGLKQQLCEALVALDIQSSKYTEKQDQHKAKLQRAKQTFVEETQWRDEKVKRLERDLALVVDSSHKDKQLIVSMSEENDKLLLEQRDLIKRISKEEEIKNNSVLAATTSQRRVNFMEVENQNLEAKTFQMSRQIAVLERTLWNLHSLHSGEELKKMLGGLENTSVKPGPVDVRNLLDVIHSSKTKYTKQAASPLSTLTESLGQPPEMGYLNLTPPQSCLDQLVLSGTFRSDIGDG